MNAAEINQNPGGSGGNWIAFVFGAVFNLLGNVKLTFLIDYALQAVVGGIICLAFKILGDVLSPLWEKHKDCVKEYTKVKRIGGLRKRKKSDVED